MVRVRVGMKLYHESTIKLLTHWSYVFFSLTHRYYAIQTEYFAFGLIADYKAIYCFYVCLIATAYSVFATRLGVIHLSTLRCNFVARGSEISTLNHFEFYAINIDIQNNAVRLIKLIIKFMHCLGVMCWYGFVAKIFVNSPVLISRHGDTGHLQGESTSPLLDSLHKGSVMRNFDVFFDVSGKIFLNKQPSCRWLESPWHSFDVPGDVLRLISGKNYNHRHSDTCRSVCKQCLYNLIYQTLIFVWRGSLDHKSFWRMYRCSFNTHWMHHWACIFFFSKSIGLFFLGNGFA